MKIKEGYMLSTIANETVVLPYSDNLDMNRMITMNDTGKFLWEQLQEEKTEDDLLQAVVVNYEDVDKDEVKGFIAEFVAKLKELDLLA